MRVLSGIGIGLGAASAEVFRVSRSPRPKSPTSRTGSVADEIQLLQTAVDRVAAELRQLGLNASPEKAQLFNALGLMIEDSELFASASGHISKGWSASSALLLAVEEFADLLSGDPLFEERAVDLRELAERVVITLAGSSNELELPRTTAVVLVGEDFSPAEVAQFGPNIVGVVTTAGGPTSHTAVLLRSMSIPAVFGCVEANDLVDGEVVLVDPAGDRVVVGADLSSATKSIKLVPKSFEPILPVRANIGSLSDAVKAATSAASGVGLLRTELLYLNRQNPPSITEQSESYREIFSASPEGPLVVRTIDVSSDKPVPFLSIDPGDTTTPGYGLLAQNRQFVVDQLVSIESARIGSGRDVWVMAPMIASASEAIEFVELARSVGDFKTGVMVEVPQFATAIGELRGKVDFISVGTNDLSQFIFETNRLAPLSPKLLSPWQPALIRTLASIASQALEAGIYSGVCGESASDPIFAIVLAGLGFDSISSSMSQVSEVRAALSSISKAEAQEIARIALTATSPEQAKALVLQALGPKAGS